VHLKAAAFISGTRADEAFKKNKLMKEEAKQEDKAATIGPRVGMAIKHEPATHPSTKAMGDLDIAGPEEDMGTKKQEECKE